MSNQESIFADQEQDPTGGQQIYHPQPINGGSYWQADEQIQSGATPLQAEYDQGYAASTPHHESWQAPQQDDYTEPYTGLGSQQWNDGKIRPQQQPARSHSMRWAWVPVMVFVLMFALISGVAYNNTNSWPASSVSVGPPPLSQNAPQSTQAFPVSERPLLKINVGTANVHILASNDSTVVSVITNGSDGGQVNSDQDGNTIAVDEPGSSGINMGDDGGTTLDITTPVNSDIELHSVSGQVDINGISGQVNINMQIGLVNLAQTTLSGQSSIHTDRGSIRFDGSLDPNGSYSIDTNVGAVDVTLPADASFNLMGDTDNIANDFGSNVVGNIPQPSLILHSDTGSVSLHKAL